MVGMQREDAVHGAGQDRVHLVFLARHGKAHVQEVRGVGQIVARIDEGLADMILVGHGSDRRQLGNHPVAGNLALARIVDVERVVVERRHGADNGNHDRHRMSIAAEALEKPRHLLMDHRVVRDRMLEGPALRLCRQFAVIEQVAGFDEVAVLGQLVDGIAAVQQHAFIAVNEGDFRLRTKRLR